MGRGRSFYLGLQESIDEILSTATNVAWSICIRDMTGQILASRNCGASMRTASVGKLLLLTEVARQFNAGDLAGRELLCRDPEHLVAGAGIWQHLHVDELSIHDLCVLVACSSDNRATNVLLKHVGFASLQELCRALKLTDTALLDYVRDDRGPSDAETLSVGSAAELSGLMAQMARRELLSEAVSQQLDTWLATGADLSMVAAAFGCDPLAHGQTDRGFSIRNKTGTDTGIRADVGVIGWNGTWLSYAVVANWETAQSSSPDTVLSTMNTVGQVLRGTLQRG